MKKVDTKNIKLRFLYRGTVTEDFMTSIFMSDRAAFGSTFRTEPNQTSKVELCTGKIVEGSKLTVEGSKL